MRILSSLVACAAVVVTAGLVVILGGLADVAATSPHAPLTRWVLETAMENAVERRAAGLRPPGSLDSPERIRAGARAYDAMCVACHGAPGQKPGILAEGLRPAPPPLAEEAHEWTAGELFWITRHGVKMTGMPAFGPTHEDAQLWEIVAFVRRLPQLGPAEYRALTRNEAEGSGAEGHDHRHDAASRAGPRDGRV